MNAGLHGWRIWVPRAAHQAAPLCDLIRIQGGEVLCLPALEIHPVVPSRLPDESFDWMIFVSVNAVAYGFDSCHGWLNASGHLAAVGRATQVALDARGARRIQLPAERFDSEALLDLPDLKQVAGRRILIVKGLGGRRKLADSLRARGADVVELAVYRRGLPEYTSEQLRIAFASPPDAAVATSCEVLDNMCRLLDGRLEHESLGLVAVSHRVADLAAERGFVRIAVSQEASDVALLEALFELKRMG